MGQLEINNKTFPPTLKMYEDGALKVSVDIGDYDNTVKQTIDSLELNMFEKIYLSKAIHLFEAETVTIKDNDEE